MRTKELNDIGVYYRHIKKLMDEGYLEEIRYGYYQWQDEKAFSEVSIVTNLFPDGILCMETGLSYYNYTSRTSLKWHIAVDYKTSRNRFKIALLRKT